MSDETHQGIIANCNFSSSASPSDTCDTFLDDANRAKGNIYIYNIYAPFCSSDSSSSSPVQGSGFDPCSSNYIYEYLNTPEVQKALHANVTGIPGPWDSCKYSTIYHHFYKLLIVILNFYTNPSFHLIRINEKQSRHPCRLGRHAGHSITHH